MPVVGTQVGPKKNERVVLVGVGHLKSHESFACHVHGPRTIPRSRVRLEDAALGSDKSQHDGGGEGDGRTAHTRQRAFLSTTNIGPVRQRFNGYPPKDS